MFSCWIVAKVAYDVEHPEILQEDLQGFGGGERAGAALAQAAI